MISSSRINTPDASCSLWFSVNYSNEPDCVKKDGKNSSKLLTNECARCNVIFNLKVDLLLSKIYGLQTHWIDYVVDPCDYLAYARCVDITATKSKTKREKCEIITPTFKCPKHSKT